MIGELDVDETNALNKINVMTHILLIGTDVRLEKKTGRNDIMLLLTISKGHERLKLTSFIRGLYVEISDRKDNRLNAAYVFGGQKLQIPDRRAHRRHRIRQASENINLIIKEGNVVPKKAYTGKGIGTNVNLLTQTGEQLLNDRQTETYDRYRILATAPALLTSARFTHSPTTPTGSSTERRFSDLRSFLKLGIFICHYPRIFA